MLKNTIKSGRLITTVVFSQLHFLSQFILSHLHFKPGHTAEHVLWQFYIASASTKIKNNDDDNKNKNTQHKPPTHQVFSPP